MSSRPIVHRFLSRCGSWFDSVTAASRPPAWKIYAAR